MHSNFQWSSVKKDLLFWLVQFKQSRRFKNKEKKKERKFIEITDGIKHSPANSLIQYTNSLIPFFFFFFFFLSFLFFFSFFFLSFFFLFFFLSSFVSFPSISFLYITDWLTDWLRRKADSLAISDLTQRHTTRNWNTPPMSLMLSCFLWKKLHTNATSSPWKKYVTNLNIYFNKHTEVMQQEAV